MASARIPGKLSRPTKNKEWQLPGIGYGCLAGCPLAADPKLRRPGGRPCGCDDAQRGRRGLVLSVDHGSPGVDFVGVGAVVLSDRRWSSGMVFHQLRGA